MAKFKQIAKKGIKRVVKSQKKRVIRSVRNTVARGITSLSGHESILTGLTDPFSDEAARARYPDSGAGKSLTFSQRFTIPFATGVAGSFAIALVPKPNFPLLEYASIAGQVATWAATYSANGDCSTNLMNTYGSVVRPTSIGLRFSNTLSATDSSGYIVIAKGGPPTLGGTTTFNPSNFSSWDDHPMAHGEQWHSVACPRASSAYIMLDRQGIDGNTEQGILAWETIYLAVFSSKVSSTVGILDITLNFEYVANEDAPIAQLSEKQPVLDTAMQTAINAVQGNHPASHRGAEHVVRGFIKREGKKALLKHVLPFVQKNALKALAV